MSNWRGANVTGIGAVTCLGVGVEALVDACLLEVSPGVPGRVHESVLADLHCYLQSDPLGRRALADIDLSHLVRNKPLLMTTYALSEAWEQHGGGEFDQETGLIFATTTAHTANWEHELPRYVAGELSAAEFAKSFSEHYLGSSIEPFVKSVGFRGPVQILSSACAAGTQALALAQKWLRAGKVRRCLVGATETWTELTVRGFGSFQLLSEKPAAPFDRQRNGINLSEASAFICLDGDVERQSFGAILGGATALDAFDFTRPHPEGRGMYQAMQRALLEAECSAADIEWVYAHGTGTQANDLAEATAIQALFGNSGPWVSSTKGAHGHALAASGVLESAAAFEALRRGVILPTANLVEPDPALPVKVVGRPERRQVGRVLKTTLGFGGVNAALVLAKEPRP